MRRTRTKPAAGCLLALVAVLLLVACGGDGNGVVGGGGGDDKAAGLSGSKSESPDKFAKNFEGLTGVTLKPMPGELFGTRLQAAGEPDRFLRFGVYSLV